MRPILVTAFVIVQLASAGVLVHDQTSVDLTDPVETPKQITWGIPQQPLMGGRPEGLEVPDPKLLDVTAAGFGWDGESLGSRDAWIHTKPVPVARAWRPPTRCNLTVTLKPGRVEHTLKNGQKYTPYPGDVYVRYSADRKNWSSWQLMKLGEHNGEQIPFDLSIGVPKADRLEYDRMINDFQQQDVPWKSDESAAAKWIDERDPAFFDKHIPYVGYVEFLIETGLSGGERLKSIDIGWSYAISGIHYPPNDNTAYSSENNPWSFRRDAR